MKPVMQKLIEWFEHPGNPVSYESLITKAKELLQEEKLELQKTYSAGYEAGKSDYEQNNR